MKKEWCDVREFHEKFGHPVAEKPVMIAKKRALSRAKWMNEEVAEFLIAEDIYCLLYTSPSPRDRSVSRMPSSA